MGVMGRGIAAALAALTFAGCGQEPTPAELAAEAERDIALVEKGNSALPPLEEIVPEAITYPDIERHDLTGPGCNYAPGTSFGTRVIARESDAVLKIDGSIVRLSPDSGARELLHGSHARYVGREHELNLDLASETDEPGDVPGEGTAEPTETHSDRQDGTPEAGTGRESYEGTVTLRDEYGRIVYQGTGLAQCGT